MNRARTLVPVLVLSACLAAAGCAAPGGDGAVPNVDLLVTPAVRAAAPRAAGLTEIPLEFRDGEEALEGLLVFDPAREGRRPGVLVVHEWWGLTEHPKEAARRLARLGYVALCADFYGKGNVTDDPAQAGKWAGRFRGEGAALARSRARVNLDALRARPEVDPGRLAVIGFCFGGTVALEAAWSGADLRAAVSFHGNPTVPTDAEASAVRASLLVLHGNADPNVKETAIAAFREAMERHRFDAAVVLYAGAEHAFTNPAANRPGARYQETAARRSWAAAEAFLAERLGPGAR